MHLLALILGIVLLPKAHTLKCHECKPGDSGTCTDTKKECPQDHQCRAERLTTYKGGSKPDVHSKSCALAKECIRGTLNFGIDKITSKCCTTELCNAQPAPEPTKSNPNGKKCFTCDGQSCTATLNCDGDEDYCISTKGHQEATRKGCASKLVCSDTSSAKKIGIIRAEVSCCQGDFCNSASSTSAGLLLLLAPLVSLVVFS